MQKFIHDNFLLQNETAVELYHNYAAGQPIIDYHCHLPPAEVAADQTWENLAQVWLNGDHYKWRQMRTNGVDEKYCTGAASEREKFDQFARIMPNLLRNPLYHWSHLELARYFALDDLLLSEKTADEVWRRAAAKLQNGLSARQLMLQSKVEIVCTTDDPVDSLEHHQAVAQENFAVKMYPTFRPDKALLPENAGYLAYLEKLAEVAGVKINSFESLVEALKKRHDFFHAQGCRLSDHGLSRAYFAPVTDKEAAEIFQKTLKQIALEPLEDEKFKTALLLAVTRLDAQKGWTKQMHFGALRNNNQKMFGQLGADTGFDSIDDQSYALQLSRFLDTLNSEDALPKMIFYNLHPGDNEMLATMLGNFQDSSTPGKMQLGSGWWFLDQKDGMEKQLEALSQLGSLSRFVGMLTDSRSFLSYTRHEYFRRILCNLLGADIEQGLLPNDTALVGEMVGNICHHNARAYFNFPNSTN